MIAREPAKLAAVERQIEEVKESGFGTILITVANGQITDSKFTIGEHWSVVSPEELTRNEVHVLTVIAPIDKI